MSLELVNAVKTAEAKADTLKKEAMAQAKQISMDNQKACLALLEEAKAQAKGYKNAALLEVDAVAEREGEKRREQVAAQGKEAIQKASVKIDTAVDIVVERIVRG